MPFIEIRLANIILELLSSRENSAQLLMLCLKCFFSHSNFLMLDFLVFFVSLNEFLIKITLSLFISFEPFNFLPQLIDILVRKKDSFDFSLSSISHSFRWFVKLCHILVSFMRYLRFWFVYSQSLILLRSSFFRFSIFQPTFIFKILRKSK